MNGLGGIIILVIVVGGWIVKAISAANESKQNKGRRPGKPRLDYEALAERRRQELQRQAQQRRAQQGRVQPTQVQQRDPATMSMAERIEMARQRDVQRRGQPTAVDEQAQALREAQERAQQQARAQAERARQEQAAQQRRAQQRKLQQQQRARQQNQPAPRSAVKQAAAAGRRRRDLSTVGEDALRKHQASHDRVLSKQTASDAQARELAANLGRHKRRKPLLDFGKLNRRSLRQAIVLKEVLDPPVALRKDQPY